MNELMQYESESQHCAQVNVRELTVVVVLTTKNVGKPTESDHEYTQFADSVYEDVVFSARLGAL